MTIEETKPAPRVVKPNLDTPIAADVVAVDATAYAPWWRRVALRLRAGLAFGVLALVMTSLLSGSAYFIIRNTLVTERSEAAQNQAFIDARLLRSRLDPKPSDMSQLLAGLQVGSDGSALLLFEDRWYSTSVDFTHELLPESTVEAIDNGSVATQRFDINGVAHMVVGMDIPAIGAQYYEVSSFAEVESVLSGVQRTLIIVGLLVTIVGALIGAALSSLVLQPLRRFAEVARKISAGESSSRLDAEGDPDLVPLANAFNDMIEELDERAERERRFASDVSHEIRGPVSTLASAVTIVERRRDQLPDEVLPAIDALQDQVETFNELVIDLLEISRFDARTAEIDPEQVDVVDLCSRLLRERNYDNVQVELHGEFSPILSIDRRRMGQVIANLLENGERYAGGVNEIRIDVTAPEVLRIEVHDSGPGVSAEERERIFGRFERGDAARNADSQNGTGLGLALSRQHVELHGGEIFVEDRGAEPGACFVIELPRGIQESKVTQDLSAVSDRDPTMTPTREGA